MKYSNRTQCSLDTSKHCNTRKTSNCSSSFISKHREQTVQLVKFFIWYLDLVPTFNGFEHLEGKLVQNSNTKVEEEVFGEIPVVGRSQQGWTLLHHLLLPFRSNHWYACFLDKISCSPCSFQMYESFRQGREFSYFLSNSRVLQCLGWSDLMVSNLLYFLYQPNNPPFIHFGSHPMAANAFQTKSWQLLSTDEYFCLFCSVITLHNFLRA